MRILLATGIYPPQIGGPATYAFSLAKELTDAGHTVTVLTYGAAKTSELWDVITVSKSGGPFLRWQKYAQVLNEYGKNVDIVYAFSSMSCGMPLLLSSLPKKKKVLRLGGDFFWERYTDRGGKMSLSEWYKSKPLSCYFMEIILSQFEHIVFSTTFQQKLYESTYKKLPKHSIIENTLPLAIVKHHEMHNPLKLLYIGRFVAVKNLETLFQALVQFPQIHLLLVGDGPRKQSLQHLVQTLNIQDQVAFASPIFGKEKLQLFAHHDALILSSFSEVSPNAALEARATGMPVLLTEQNGLSQYVKQGMLECPMSTIEDVQNALSKLTEMYDSLAEQSIAPLTPRTWQQVSKDHILLFQSLI